MASPEFERPASSACESQPEASTSGSRWEADAGARSWAPARDTGIQLAAAEEYNPDQDDVRNAMQKYLPEGEKRRVLGEWRRRHRWHLLLLWLCCCCF